MSGVWGWIGEHGGNDPRVSLDRIATPSPIETGTSVGARHALGAGHWHGSALIEHDGVLVAFAGHPRTRDDQADPDLDELAVQLAHAFRKGDDVLGQLRGEFALAILDPSGPEALVAVDRMGVFDLAHAPCPGGLVFAPRASAIARDPRCRADVSVQALYDYCYHHVVPRPGTIFNGIERLLPGGYVHLRRGQIQSGRYWRPTFDEDGTEGFAELRNAFRGTLRSVVARGAGAGRVGAFLSGGTDSSTVAGTLGEVTGERPRTFAIGFDAPGYDETAYARIAARHFDCDHHEYFVTPADVVAAVPDIARASDQPYGNASVVPSYYCARLARSAGIEVLLGGDGGDELFAGNARYARQWLLSLYDRLPSALRQHVLDRLGRPGPAWKIPPLRKLGRYIEQASAPLPDRLEGYNLIDSIGIDRLFAGTFHERLDRQRPLEALRHEYSSVADATLVNRLLAIDFKYTLADDDLRKVTLAGELAGVETRFPLLDDEMVELAARVPPGLKLRGTRLRYFFKRALREFLPREILTKQKHGFGLPFGVWLREHEALRELAGDSLSGLAGRGILHPGMVDELLGKRLDEHAGFYGTLAWVLMMLEQWLEQNEHASGHVRTASTGSQRKSQRA